MSSLPYSVPCVALDLETTGLRPEADEIIEIGAVLSQGNETLATFHRMVDPGRPLPGFVSLLTGIAPAALRGAPRFAEVRDDLVAFIGDHPLVGQNISFDLGFLALKKVYPRGPVYDTRDLSRLLQPDVTDHGLAALAASFGITNASPHRAVADAETTMRVFQRLWDRMMALEPETLGACIVLALRAGDAWALGRLVREAARLRDIAVGSASDAVRALVRRLSSIQLDRPALEPRLVREPGLSRLVGTVFGPEGTLARILPSYEPRPQQVAMAARVAQALENGETLLVEAPAGTGKSLAYLVPALLFAHANQTPVAIATSTKGLQEQLAGKDLPTALKAAGLQAQDVPVTVLKGRGNYLCLSRLLAALERPDLTPEEVPFLARILVWLESTRGGDVGELALGQEETARWGALSTGTAEEHAECRYQRAGACFLARARKDAQGAYLVITNHSLLLADSEREEGTLSHIRHLILDEAHHLEREATEQYGRRVTQREMDDLLVALGARTGRPRLLPGALAKAAVLGAVARQEGIAERGAAVGASAATAFQRGRDFFQRLGGLLTNQGEGLPDAEVRLRLTGVVRRGRDWQAVGETWKELELALSEAARTLGAFRDTLEGAAGLEPVRELDELVHRLNEVRARLETAIARPGSDSIAWASRHPEGRDGVTIHWAPLSVGPLLLAGLFREREAVVFASATLATAGNFAFVKDRLGLKQAAELCLDSPFDYRAAATIFVPSDMPEPDASDYTRAVERAIISLAPLAGGGVLVLFTSYSALRQTYTAVRSKLQDHGIPVIAQGIDGPAARLVEIARRQPRTVLLGAATFWEGVDLAGEALRLLIITRLPFSVPNDPVIAARAETYVDPFGQFTVPNTLLRFRQGLGRLVRSGRDQGAIVVLDARMLTRSYGARFLDALPSANLATPSLAELPREVGGWLQGKAGN